MHFVLDTAEPMRACSAGTVLATGVVFKVRRDGLEYIVRANYLRVRLVNQRLKTFKRSRAG